VKVYTDGQVAPLEELDRKTGGFISGGHLLAQQNRFGRLWRVAFFIDGDAKKRLEKNGQLSLLVETIERGILRIPPKVGDIDPALAGIAQQMTTFPESPWAGKSTVELDAARQHQVVRYPGGAPSLRAFIVG
jgi:hypothetical protein